MLRERGGRVLVVPPPSAGFPASGCLACGHSRRAALGAVPVGAVGHLPRVGSWPGFRTPPACVISGWPSLRATRAARSPSTTLDDGQQARWPWSGRRTARRSSTSAAVAPIGRGEVPNPTSDPAGADQVVWRVSAGGSEAPVKIGPGHGAAVLPRGDGVAFISHGKILWAPFAGRAEPMKWVEARGGARELRFSPDGSKLAFVSDRGDHGFVGVYGVATKTLLWMAPSVDSDYRARVVAGQLSPGVPPHSGVVQGHALSLQPERRAVVHPRGGCRDRAGEDRLAGGSRSGERLRGDGGFQPDPMAAGDRLIFPGEGRLAPSLLRAGRRWDGDHPDARRFRDRDRQSHPGSPRGGLQLQPGRSRPTASLEGRGYRGRPVPLTKGNGIEWLPASTWGQVAGLPALRSEAAGRDGDPGGGGEARSLAAGSGPASFPESP